MVEGACARRRRYSVSLGRALNFAALFLVFALPAIAGDALKFFNNWFITGDYAVAGTGLSATQGVGTIQMSGVPCVNGIAMNWPIKRA